MAEIMSIRCHNRNQHAGFGEYGREVVCSARVCKEGREVGWLQHHIPAGTLFHIVLGADEEIVQKGVMFLWICFCCYFSLSTSFEAKSNCWADRMAFLNNNSLFLVFLFLSRILKNQIQLFSALPLSPRTRSESLVNRTVSLSHQLRRVTAGSPWKLDSPTRVAAILEFPYVVYLGQVKFPLWCFWRLCI